MVKWLELSLLVWVFGFIGSFVVGLFLCPLAWIVTAILGVIAIIIIIPLMALAFGVMIRDIIFDR